MEPLYILAMIPFVFFVVFALVYAENHDEASLKMMLLFTLFVSILIVALIFLLGLFFWGLTNLVG